MNTNQPHAQRQFALAIGAFMIAFILWQYSFATPIVYPLRLLVTFIHELGHGTATLLTGGNFLRFEVASSGAGVAFSRGGIREIIISAGYLGTAVFGSVLLYVTNRIRRPEYLAIGLGIGFSILTLFYTGLTISNLNFAQQVIAFGSISAAVIYFLVAEENQGRMLAALGGLGGLVVLIFWSAGDNTLTVIVGVLAGAALIGIGYLGMRGHTDITLFALNFLAFIVGLNAITDSIFLFHIVNNSQLAPHNDATSMAAETGLSASIWAGVWILTAISLLGFSIWMTFVRRAYHQHQQRVISSEVPITPKSPV
jgi:hypothetical protein